ncbi:T9SS type A sorting domain-containing protein, partial [Neolewinella lacunae]
TGTIATRTDRAMANVAVTLTGEGTADQMTMTDAAGIYYFTDLNMGIDYTVQPEYAVAVNVQDVKTSDIVKITKVILGAEDFDSPYDYLAADVDQNRNLNVLDLVGIQRVILGLDANYVTGESWGFVPADVDVSNPYAAAFPEVYNANDLTGSILDADFVAFAYGDVVGNGRSTASINAADAQLEAGQMHTMEIRGTALAGFQGTIELAAGLELVTASYAGEGAINLNRAGDGLVAVALRGADAVLTLEVMATAAGRLSELVSLTDEITVREGVNLNGTGGALTLSFTTAEVATGLNALLQNTPNPVRGETVIRYELAVAGAATLTVQDAAGRLLLTRKLEATAGRNQVTLTAAELGAAGVLTYTLTAGDFTATRKMVVVR